MKPKIDLKPHLDAGFNKSQATSLAWAEVFEERQLAVEYKYQGAVDGTVRIDTWCKDCQKGGQFIPDSVRTFIGMHKDHKTTTFRIK